MSSEPAQPTLLSDEYDVQLDADECWRQALEKYKQETGRDLLKHTFAHDLLSQTSTDEVVARLKKFKEFRASGRKILRVLKPIVSVVLRLVDAGAEGASKVAPGGKAIFVAVGALLQATRGVSQVYDSVESLLQQIKGYVDRVGIHLAPSTPPTPALMRILLDTLVQVLNVLAIVTKYCDRAVERHSWLRKAGNVVSLRTRDYLRVMIDKTGVKEVLSQHEELAKTELHMTVTHTNAIAREVKTKVDYMHHKAVIDDMRNWLDPPIPRPTNYDLKRQMGSCSWFFDAKFEDWKAHKNGIYWVYGNAGSGKSVLSFSVVDKLKADATLPVAYFHFDFNDSRKQDFRALMSSLVFQLGTYFEECLKYLQEKRSPESPTNDELLIMLSRLLSLAGRVFIVIDALDECPGPARDRALVAFLDTLSGLKEDNLRLLITSRPVADIRKHISRFATHSLSFHDALTHRAGLSFYVQKQLSDSDYWWPEDIKEKARKVLTDRSNGMFLWVDLQLRDLKFCDPRDVDCMLYELPSGLDETYERILKNFPSQGVMVDRARRVFECVAFARRPLTPAQIAGMVFVNLESSAEQSCQVPAVEDPEAFILKQCPGLLDIVESFDGEEDDGDMRRRFYAGDFEDRRVRVVQFTHFSVREYLTSHGLQRATSPVCNYYLSEYSANLTLARLCLSALVSRDYLSNMQRYAMKYWYSHMSYCNDDSDSLDGILSRFIHPDSVSFKKWIRQYQILDSPPSIDTTFHWAIRLGFRHYVKRMLGNPQNCSSAYPTDTLVSARGVNGETPLHCAVKFGHIDIARILLEHGARTDDIDHRSALPLHIASFHGRIDIVSLLLKHRVHDGFETAAFQCRARDDRGLTALHEAAIGGHAQVSRVLIDNGALVDNNHDKGGKTPLHYAVCFKHWDVVCVLFDGVAKGSDTAALRCREVDVNGLSALHYACEENLYDIACLLLDYGAIIGGKHRGVTALHKAMGSHSELLGLNLISVLLNHSRTHESNAAIHACDYEGQTVLHQSALFCGPKTCRLLLDYGPLVDIADDQGRTPLLLAEKNGNPETVLMLLKHCALKRPRITLVERAKERGLRNALRTRANNDRTDGPWRTIYEIYEPQFEKIMSAPYVPPHSESSA